jgi:hypothetical protein
MSFRVPDGMSRPTRSGSHVSTNLSLAVDEDGFFGRECPNAKCRGYFKLAVDEYGLARERHRLTCPVCGTTESDEHFFTKTSCSGFGRPRSSSPVGRPTTSSATSDAAGPAGPGRSRSGGTRRRRTTQSRCRPMLNGRRSGRSRVRTAATGRSSTTYSPSARTADPTTPRPRAVFDDTMAAMARLMRVVTEQPPEDGRSSRRPVGRQCWPSGRSRS